MLPELVMTIFIKINILKYVSDTNVGDKENGNP